MKISVVKMQDDLIVCLKLFGCSTIEILVIMARLWHPDDMREMLLFMAEHRAATPAQLYEISSKISSKRGDPPEIEEEEDEEDDEWDE